MVMSTLLLPTRRAALSLILACALAIVVSLAAASRRAAVTTERLHDAERELAALAEGPSEATGRAAIAWGYTERMRLGLESPFRLIESASRDPRLTLDERGTVSWALLAALLRGESHQIEPAALDLLSRGAGVRGEPHLAIVESRISEADDPRVAELALRFAYALAASERLIASSGQTVIAQAAALVADREIARREAGELMRGTHANGLIAAIAQSRRRRELYVERPVLMAPSPAIEPRAIELVPGILDELRALDGPVSERTMPTDSVDELPSMLYAAARRSLPSAVVGVTTRRFLPALAAELSPAAISRIAQASNGEMFVSAIAGSWSRSQRRLIGRLQMAVAVATRTNAQEPVWVPGDTAPLADVGVRSVSFDADVPAQWRSYYLASLDRGIRDLKVVFPELRLDEVNVRFRMRSPADSALAMHEPQSRTLHLPVSTAAGTLSHEIAHDLDRQLSRQQGRKGYWSDVSARGDGNATGSANRVAASLRTLSGEMSVGVSARATSDRPAEIFATRVDWFVAQTLARQGMTSGFLSAVQDEVLTGHVLHPERLRGAGRSRSLITALEGMTTVAPFARRESEPTAYSLMQFVLRAPLDRRALRGYGDPAFVPTACKGAARGPAGLLRLAAVSRARGIVRGRAESIPANRRPAWARSALGEAPWAPDAAEDRVDLVAAELLGQLTAPGLQMGAEYRAATLLRSAPCGG